MALVESIGKPTLDGRAVPRGDRTKLQTGEMVEALRWSQTVIELADGDPTKGNFIIGSPLAMALASRGTARCGAGPCGVARRLRPGAGHGPQHRPDARMPSSSHTPTVAR